MLASIPFFTTIFSYCCLLEDNRFSCRRLYGRGKISAMAAAVNIGCDYRRGAGDDAVAANASISHINRGA